MRFDLHAHTTASDGTLTPELLVAHACALDLTAIAITDHDSVDSVVPALKAACGTDLTVISGVELSTSHGEMDVHILGYFVNPHDRPLLDTLHRFRAIRRERAVEIVDALSDAGMTVSLDRVLALSADGAVGRSHVARALVDAGLVPTVGEAFQRFLGRGRPFYRPKPPADPALAVRTIVQSGGIAILAHPGVTGADSLLPTLLDAGLGGIEAYHAEHTPAQRSHYAALARDLGLLVTGGSDYHGIPGAGVELGSVEIPDHVLTDLVAASARPGQRS
jgi:hypothetical protein